MQQLEITLSCFYDMARSNLIAYGLCAHGGTHMPNYTVGDLVAEFLEGCGVKMVFGLASVHNVPMLDAIGRRGRIRFVTPRGEAGAAHMADGYARASGGLGAVFTSTGPGAANAIPGLMESLLARSPVLHFTGQTATAHLGKDQGTTHDLPKQQQMLAAVSKATFRITSPTTALDTMRAAVSAALTPPRGPVSIEIPIDIQRCKMLQPDAIHPATPWVAPRASEGEVRRVADIVRTARKPLIWAGSGALAAAAPIRRLLDLGFGLVTSWSGRGVVSEADERVLGAYNAGLSEDSRRVFRDADLLLVAGSRVRAQQTRDLRDHLPSPRIHIDIDSGANGRTYAADLFVEGDSAAVLTELVRQLEGTYQAAVSWHAEIAASKHRASVEYRSTLGAYCEFPLALRKALPADAILVRDLTWHSIWAHYAFPILGPRCNLFPVTGAIGSGLQTGIGAALSQPDRKTVLMSGDGGFFMHHGELWTAIADNADLLMIVMNDQTYTLIEHVQDALSEGRHFYSKLKNPDLGRLATLAGIPFWRVSKADDFEATVREAVRQEGPRLIEVDMLAIGEAPSGYIAPPYVKG